MQETYKLEERNWAAKLMAIVVVVTMVTSTFVLFAPEASARTGSDSYGYVFKDQAESDGPTYSWVDILSTGTKAVFGTTDGAQGPFDIGFDFEFYATPFDQFYTGGDNGYITFGGAVGNAWTPYALPATQLGSNAVAAGWFDGGFCLGKNTDSGVYYETKGSEGSRTLVVTMQDQVYWSARDGTSYCNSGHPWAMNTITWQIILHEGSNDILIQYQDATGGSPYDNEYLTAGIQGNAEGVQYGLQYKYRNNPSTTLADQTTVIFKAPPPVRNDLQLSGTSIPDPISLADDNFLGAEITNKGVNCGAADGSETSSCTPVPETGIDVNAEIFSVKETVMDYDWNDRTEDNGFTSASLNGGTSMWTQNINDGNGAHNYGEDGTDDGTFSSGRKAGAFGGLFNDQQRIHYDGADIVVADMRSNSIKKMSGSDQSVTTLIGPDTTNLRDVLDITSDDDYYYTLARTSGTFSAVTKICKWDKTSPYALVTCNASSIRYGTAITIYEAADELFVLQTYSSNAYRKIIGLSTSNLATNGKTLNYGNGVSSYYYSQDLDIDETTGDLYVTYREYSGRLRGYERQSDGTYCATSSCHNQIYSGAAYGISVEVHDDYVYHSAYYYLSSYGGMKRMSTGLSGGVTTLWGSYSGGQYKGSIAVTDDADIYVSSNYAYSYSSFSNYQDAVYFWDSADYGSVPTKTLGPKPPYLAVLTTPTINAEDAVGLKMSFKASFNFYYMYEGAYMEISKDGGSTWTYVDNDHLSGNKYYGTTYATYDNPLDITRAAWTYYNINHGYQPNVHTGPWKETSAVLDEFTGTDSLQIRWVVGFNNYLQTYYNSWFRLDDIKITLLEKDEVFGDETQTIDSLAFKATESVSFFETNKFKPSERGLEVGDSVGITITVPGFANDQNKDNQAVSVFREVKFVIFADDFDGDDKGWITGKVQFGTSDWEVRSLDSTSGSSSMDSGKRNSNSVPSDTFVSTANLDLGLPVEASAQMKISYYAYYTYSGYQAQISEDGGASWTMIKPVGGYPNSIYNYAYYGNPLRGQPGYTYYGSSTGYTSSPDPQGWIDVVFDLNAYTGQDDIRFRWVAGWSSLNQNYNQYNSFLRFDDFAVTGLVYNDNVGLSKLELPDPIGIDDTVTLSTTVLNAGINNQTAGAAKVRLQLGPLGLATYDESDDFEGYTTTSDVTSAGWSFNSECNALISGTCTGWGSPAGASLTDDGTTQALGPGNSYGEFAMYSGAGTTEVVTPTLDFTGAENDLTLTLKHRYNFDYYGGMGSIYNGGNVQISTDDGTTWELLTPSGGYPGTIGGYTFYGNPLMGEQAFVHCGDCSGVSNTARDNKDKYIESEFVMGDYVGQTQVKLKFVTGMYKYQYFNDGEHWYIDSLKFTGTGMESISYTEIRAVSGSGEGSAFESGDKYEFSHDFHFQVPGEYKIAFDAWIGSDPSDGDDFAGDNSVSLARETMFTIAATTADAGATSKKNDELNRRYYEDDWTSAKDGGAEGGTQWRPSSTSASSSPDSPVWWVGPNVAGSANNGDDTSLMSPVFDLSQATSAKLVFEHAFAFYASASANPIYYEGGRVEISTNGGTTWAGLPITSGEDYAGVLYNYAYYGNPLGGQIGFGGASSEGTNLVESQCSLNDYTGAGFDNMRLRFRYGGAFVDWGSTWNIDNIGIYGLGFDLAQTSSSTPYTLEVGEATTMTTSFKNQGQGNLGSGGAMETAYAYAYVNDMSGNELWSASSALTDLNGAYYDELGDSHPGESTPTISFDFPGMPSAGMYSTGVMVADANGDMLSDLFSANNDANHMLLVGKSAEMGIPALAGGSDWAASTNAPAVIDDGALGVSWDATGVATGTLAIDIGGQGAGYTPASPEVQLGTTVTWTNTDSLTHTVTDKESQSGLDSGNIEPGESYTVTFNTVGVFNYFCTQHIMMEGSITVVSSASGDEQARTNFIKVWSEESYLVFWAKHDISDDSTISVYAQKEGSAIDDQGTIALWGANGFKIMDGSDHSEVGDSLTGDSDWNPYYIDLNSDKLGYNSLAYSPEEDNSYSFVFRARGVEGTAEIGNVEVIRTQDTGIFFAKNTPTKLTYEIFPSLAVEIDYFAKNIGTVDNEFQFTPTLVEQGEVYDGAAFTISVEVLLNGAEGTYDSTPNADGSDTYSIDTSPDDEALITVRFLAPEYDVDKGEPAGNRKFDVRLDPYDSGSDEEMREPISATLFIKPSQFVLGWMKYDRQGVLEGDSLAITVQAWNEGNYASNILLVVYVMDPTGTAYETPNGIQRMTRVASTTEPVMAPKPVLESDGIYQTWYPITAVWEEVFLPTETSKDYGEVQLYAMINPDPEDQDIDNGFSKQDEYLNQKDDNDASGMINVVKDKSSTPSFALGIAGMSVAALIAAAGASLRRKEE